MFYVKKNNNNGIKSWSDFLFDDFFDFSFPRLFGDDQLMKTDIKEENDKYVMEMDIPGFEKEDIKISYEDNYLTVVVEKKEEKEAKDKNYIRRERGFGSKSRSFYFDDVDSNKIQAAYKNGILTVTLPKVEVKEVDKKYITIE